MFIAEEQLTQNRVTVDVAVETETETQIFDPLAQTFFNENSCFITAIDIYFEAIGDNDTIWVQLKNTVNGYPGPIVIGETLISSRGILTSTDASIVTKIEFPFPLFIEGDKEYAIVVGSFSPESRIFCSLLGKYDLTYTNQLIDSQPSLGTLFKGQNNSTWTASQYEDMKINIYRAVFKYDTLSVVLQNKDSNEYIESFNPFETQSGSNQIRVYARNHGMSIGDNVTFNVFERSKIHLTTNILYNESYDLIKNLKIGHEILAYNTLQDLTNDTNEINYIGRATINSIVMDTTIIETEEVLMAKCELINFVGKFTETAFIKTRAFELQVSDIYDNKLNLIHGPALSVPETYPETLNQTPMILSVIALASKNNVPYTDETPLTVHGINVSNLNETKQVSGVDSIDTFIIESDISNPATDTGRCGEYCKFPINRRYELFNVAGAYSAIDCDEEWALYGMGMGINDLFGDTNNTRLYGKQFIPNTNVYLKQPYKFFSKINEIYGKGIITIANFKTYSPYISPVIDVSTFNAIMVSNRVDFIDQWEIDVLPNQSNRFKAETDPGAGSEVFKYVTKNIVLKNPAMDLKLFLDVYKPIYTDFDIYLKVQPTWDYTSIDVKPWIKLDPVWKEFTSKDLTDYREVQVVTNELMPTIFGDDPGSIGEFTSFKIKIVGRARNPANPPLFRKLRAIALT